MKKSNAMTLAEVLITLGIIGVVAAITIPILYGAYQKIVISSKCKKFESIMTQAIRMAGNDWGDVSSWDVESSKRGGSSKNSEIYAQRLIPYLKISEDCGFRTDCNFPNEILNANGSKWNNYTQNPNWYYKIILADGSFVVIKSEGDNCTRDRLGYKNYCGYMLYDINGAKRPNRITKDTFVFAILKDRVAPEK